MENGLALLRRPLPQPFVEVVVQYPVLLGYQGAALGAGVGAPGRAPTAVNFLVGDGRFAATVPSHPLGL